MPRQGWETNKAGGKGPAVARESDKWLLQPGCPVHPHVETGPQTVQIHAGLSLVGRAEPSPGCAARFEHCCAPSVLGEQPAASTSSAQAVPGARQAQAVWAEPGATQGVQHKAGQAGRQMDGSSASIPHPFSPRQTPSDFHKSKRHTV